MPKISAEERKWLRRLLGDRVRFDDPLARRTTFRIGGPAEALVMPAGVDELSRVVKGAHRRGLPMTVLGGGSNVLICDGGIRGIVIALKPHLRTVTAHGPDGTGAVLVTAQAGLTLPALCRTALAQGWAGMNFALGIPGCVGGAIAMNAGSAGGVVADLLETVTLIDKRGEISPKKADTIAWHYRRAEWPEKSIIVDGTFRLQTTDREKLRREARQWVRTRKKSQPAASASAGCFFKNPSPEKPAGRLIEQAGLKGKRVGDAQVSDRHANFIINRGNARASDVLALKQLIEKRVAERFGVILDPEVVILGEQHHA